MSFQKFTLGLVAAFGLPWLLLIIAPFAKMRSVQAVSFDEEKDGKTGTYTPERPGRISNGSDVYQTFGAMIGLGRRRMLMIKIRVANQMFMITQERSLHTLD